MNERTLVRDLSLSPICCLPQTRFKVLWRWETFTTLVKTLVIAPYSNTAGLKLLGNGGNSSPYMVFVIFNSIHCMLELNTIMSMQAMGCCHSRFMSSALDWSLSPKEKEKRKIVNLHIHECAIQARTMLVFNVVLWGSSPSVWLNP